LIASGAGYNLDAFILTAAHGASRIPFEITLESRKYSGSVAHFDEQRIFCVILIGRLQQSHLVAEHRTYRLIRLDAVLTTHGDNQLAKSETDYDVDVCRDACKSLFKSLCGPLNAKQNKVRILCGKRGKPGFFLRRLERETQCVGYLRFHQNQPTFDDPSVFK